MRWRPDDWAKTFKAAGASYVVLTSKHHDSFCLWPSGHPNPKRRPESQHSARDVVGELTYSVRTNGMEMGIYYSGGYDWSFRLCPGKQCEPEDEEYERLAYAHLAEIAEKYKPAILWNDIGWPGNGTAKPTKLYSAFSKYLNTQCPKGVINRRWFTDKDKPKPKYIGDYDTREYIQTDTVSPVPFEYCRGIGRSFGYNAEETDEDYMTPAEALWLLADIVAKGGSLLLDVGPKPDGSLPEGQGRVLQAFAEWNEEAGEAIHGTKPFLRPGTKIAGGVRYTMKEPYVYAIVQCLQGCHGWVKLDLPDFMRPHRTPELLQRGGPVPLARGPQGWKLPNGFEQPTMPLALRFKDVAP